MELDLDQARRRAKELLRAARAQDPDALARMRAADPGFASWPALVERVETSGGDRAEARARFVAAAPGGRAAAVAEALLELAERHHVRPPAYRARMDPQMDLNGRLAELRERGLYRRMRLVSGPQGPRVVLDGKPVLVLCSGNALGLADHPRVREAAADAAMRWGVGAGGSRLAAGTMTIHRRLEERLAGFAGAEAAVLFGSGHLAGLGVVSALAPAGGVVLCDELAHAALADGARLARADAVAYRHGDVEHLVALLREYAGRPALIATESVFALDGDVAPLEDLVAVARRFGALLVVDEAHALGCAGPGGRGAVAEAGLEGEVDVLIGSLGKALGSYGGYALCTTGMARWLVNRARTFTGSTAPAPPAVAGALAALELLAEQPQRVQRLRANGEVLRAALAREGFEPAGSTTHVVSLAVGDARLASAVCDGALNRGVLVEPAGPQGAARVRLAAMATHSREELAHAARALGRAAEKASFRPAEAATAAARPFDGEDLARAA